MEFSLEFLELFDQDKYDEAGSLYRRVMAIREKVLGDEHPDTANTLYNLANLLEGQCSYKEAETLYRRALAIHEKVLGCEHPDTIDSINNLERLLNRRQNVSFKNND